MRCKVVLAGLVLLMLIFCSASQSQAAIGKNSHIRPFDQVVDEHPWQESGAPESDVIISALAINKVFIIIGYSKILFIENPLQPKATQIGKDHKGDSTPNNGIW